MFNLSASMAKAFVDAVQTMTDRARELGPNPLRKIEERSGENAG